MDAVAHTYLGVVPLAMADAANAIATMDGRSLCKFRPLARQGGDLVAVAFQSRVAPGSTADTFWRVLAGAEPDLDRFPEGTTLAAVQAVQAAVTVIRRDHMADDAVQPDWDVLAPMLVEAGLTWADPT